MANKTTYTRADKVFADQFEPTDGGDFIYRRNRSGPAVKVTPHERDQFVDHFVAARTWAGRGLMAAMIALAVLGATLFSDTKSSNFEQFLWISMSVAVVGFLIVWKWAWNAPARTLAERPQIAPPIEKLKARQASLRRMKWGQFIWAGIAVTIGGVWLATKIDLMAGWHPIILVAGALYIGLAILRVCQKWQADHVPD
ncbi:hypothetical protein GRI58_12320 [Porphyrobacter algicida]|uniref:Uncharacterized protein n=1 Tax=Qipengyuania algicida TaxID=1836209 RepID=A0A845AG96_9SPHN|nr:hypothetical protein [Qipengyuania algicida]MXP29602.1 hypothetical protein [Qipengyuania algicida]